jgi:hypothetical protein
LKFHSWIILNIILFLNINGAMSDENENSFMMIVKKLKRVVVEELQGVVVEELQGVVVEELQGVVGAGSQQQLLEYPLRRMPPVYP